jgi:hypothetical protein
MTENVTVFGQKIATISPLLVVENLVENLKISFCD